MSRKGINPAKHRERALITPRVKPNTYFPKVLPVKAVQWYGGPNELYGVYDWIIRQRNQLHFKGDPYPVDEAFVYDHESLILVSDSKSLMVPYGSWILVDEDLRLTFLEDVEFRKLYFRSEDDKEDEKD